MSLSHRRQFLADVGRGMLVAGVGSTLAQDLGLATSSFAKEDDGRRLTFGSLEPLATLMEQTPADKRRFSRPHNFPISHPTFSLDPSEFPGFFAL